MNDELMFGSDDGKLYRYDINKKKIVNENQVHDNRISCISLNYEH